MEVDERAFGRACMKAHDLSLQDCPGRGTEIQAWLRPVFECYEAAKAPSNVQPVDWAGVQVTLSNLFIGYGCHEYKAMDYARQATNYFKLLQSTMRESIDTRTSREAEMWSALVDAGQILNAIRARDGTWGDFSPLYFDQVVDHISKLLGGDILRAMWKKMADEQGRRGSDDT